MITTITKGIIISFMLTLSTYAFSQKATRGELLGLFYKLQKAQKENLQSKAEEAYKDLLYLNFDTLLCYSLSDDITVSIKESAFDHQTRHKAESNLSRLLIAFNRAVIKGTLPWKIDDYCTKSAQKEILTLWQKSPISCPVSKIEEKCLFKTGNHRIANIAITIMDAALDEQEQELIICFTPNGYINKVYVQECQNIIERYELYHHP